MRDMLHATKRGFNSIHANCFAKNRKCFLLFLVLLCKVSHTWWCELLFPGFSRFELFLLTSTRPSSAEWVKLFWTNFNSFSLLFYDEINQIRSRREGRCTIRNISANSFENTRKKNPHQECTPLTSSSWVCWQDETGGGWQWNIRWLLKGKIKWEGLTVHIYGSETDQNK